MQGSSFLFAEANARKIEGTLQENSTSILFYNTTRACMHALEQRGIRGIQRDYISITPLSFLHVIQGAREVLLDAYDCFLMSPCDVTKHCVTLVENFSSGASYVFECTKIPIITPFFLKLRFFFLNQHSLITHFILTCHI